MEQADKKIRPVIRAWLILIMAWTISFSFSCLISFAAWNAGSNEDGDSITGLFLGESRVALSGHFNELAETYFHGGSEDLRKEAFSDSIFQKVAGEIAPQYHIHLGGTDIREIMPWLKLAIMMNPSNVTLSLDAAFCLRSEANRPDLAEQVLLEAQANNPYNYEIQLERGQLFLKEKRVLKAIQAFDAGLAFWPKSMNQETFETRNGKTRLLLYRALLYEVQDRKQEAISCLKEIVSIFPERTVILDRIQTLEKGNEPSFLASRVLADMLKKDAEQKNVDQCNHPGEK